MKASLLLCFTLLVASVCGFRPASEILGDEALAIDYEIIDYVNSLKTSWTAGHNERLVGMKVKDVKKLCGVPADNLEKNDLPIAEIDVGEAALPDTFDARTQWDGCIGPILDQGHCGSCWAFGAVEALSDRFCIGSKGTRKVALSPQDLTSCDSSSNGCNGGYPYLAWRYMQSTGVVTEECYPYEMGTCNHPGCSDLPTPPCNKTCANGAKFPSDKHFASSAKQIPRDVVQIQTEIYTNGPVEGTFTVYADFNNYKSGVYYHTTGAQEGGHAIKIIGWGTENGVAYWLVANSWNTNWGDSGYFKIRRGTNECGIESGVVAGLIRDARAAHDARVVPRNAPGGSRLYCNQGASYHSGYNYFTQQTSYGVMGSQISSGTWGNGYQSCASFLGLNGVSYVYCQRGSGDSGGSGTWFIQSLGTDGHVGAETAHGGWANRYDSCVTFTINGVTYVAAVQNPTIYQAIFFIQTLGGSGTMGAQTQSTWLGGYSTIAAVTVGSTVFLYLQQAGNYVGWKILRVAAGGYATATASGSLDRPYSSCTGMSIGGRGFVYCQQSSADAGLTSWFIREINADGTLSAPTSAGNWGYSYSSCTTVIQGGNTYIYGQQAEGDASNGYNWFLQQVNGGGVMGAQTSYGTWRNGYRACVSF